MALFLRLVCALCLGLCVIGVVAPGLLAPLRPQRVESDSTTTDGSESEPNPTSKGFDDHAAHPAKDGIAKVHSPMIEALDTVIEQNDRALGAFGDQLQGDLARADQLLTESKRKNRDAIQQAGRRIRLPGRSPHLLLVLVQGLTADSLHCYNEQAAPTPGFDQLAERGVKLLHFEPPRGTKGSDWSCLVDGSTSPSAARSQSFVTALWQGGYDTAFIGDASRFTGDPRGLRFDHWYGFRTAADAVARVPTSVWSDDKQLDLRATSKPNSNPQQPAIASHLVLLEEAIQRLASPAQSRPVFTLVLLQTTGWTITERDAIPSLVAARLERSRLTSSTVVMIAGASAGRSPGGLIADENSTDPTPFLITWPKHCDRGTAVERQTAWADIAATLSEIAEVSTRPMSLRGVSQLREWQSGPKQASQSDKRETPNTRNSNSQ